MVINISFFRRNIEEVSNKIIFNYKMNKKDKSILKSSSKQISIATILNTLILCDNAYGDSFTISQKAFLYSMLNDNRFLEVGYPFIFSLCEIVNQNTYYLLNLKEQLKKQ